MNAFSNFQVGPRFQVAKTAVTLSLLLMWGQMNEWKSAQYNVKPSAALSSQ